MQVAKYHFNNTQAFMLPVLLKVGRVSMWPFLGLVFFCSFVSGKQRIARQSGRQPRR